MAFHLSHMVPFNPGLVDSGNGVSMPTIAVLGPCVSLPMCDSRDAEGHRPVNVPDKKDSYCVLSTSASVPGIVCWAPGT